VPLGGDEKSTRSPQCGCDGVTYWNETVAAHHGMSIRGSGACGGVLPALVCTGAGTCAGAKCNMHYAQKSSCNQAPQGTCWMPPTTCPVTVGSKTRACGAAIGVCSDDCPLIKSETAFFDDANCPG
jgi:hypothetical protein